MESKPQPAGQIRDVIVEDYWSGRDVSAVLKFRRKFLPSSSSFEDDRRIWDWKTSDNPFRGDRVPHALIAWSGDAVAGILTLIPCRFCLAGQNVSAVGLAELCVDPVFGGAGRKLLQTAIDRFPDSVVYTTSANTTANRLYHALKFTRVPSWTMMASVRLLPPSPTRIRYRAKIASEAPAPNAFDVPAAFMHRLDADMMDWRYARYPLARPVFLSLVDVATGLPALNAVVQISDLDAHRCVMVMDHVYADGFTPDVCRAFASCLKDFAGEYSCNHMVVGTSSQDERTEWEKAGCVALDEQSAPGCWVMSLPAGIDASSVSWKDARVTLGMGDRFFTNATEPPILERRYGMFTYRLKEPDDSLKALSKRATLLIRTSPFDHWSYVLERLLNLCGPERLTVLTNLDLPESFTYLFPPFRVLRYPRGKLDAAILPADVRDALGRLDVDQIVFTSHSQSIRHPREILESFENIFQFARTVWPDNCPAVWVADWSYELKRLDDHYMELNAISHDSAGLSYLSTLIKNHLTALLPHLESFNALVANPKPVDLIPERRLMVLAPHPDDDFIGCGGTLIKAAAAGDHAIQIVHLTDGSYASGPHDRDEMVRVRREEAMTVTRTFLLPDPVCLNFPALPTFTIREEYVQALADTIRAFRPDGIWIPFVFDRHPDHKRANVLLSRALRACDSAAAIYSYETWSMVPANVLVDITACMEKKRQAIALFKSQSMAFDYVHCTTATNAYRSWMVNGSGYYEAFFRLPREKYLSLIDQITKLEPA